MPAFLFPRTKSQPRLTPPEFSIILSPTAGETGTMASAEGATAPETLRQPDRSSVRTLESGLLAASPKEQPALSREISQGKDRGGTHSAGGGASTCRLEP